MSKIKQLSCDIETFSSVDLKKSGVYKYAESPDFEILLFGYSVDGGDVQVIDYVTGVMCAVVDKTLSSDIGAKGIFKKVLIFVLVGVGHIIDTQALGGMGTVRTAVIFFYLSNEGVSILENTTHLGLPVPDKLKAILEQLNEKDEEGEDA